jgi:Family of unknown function (DUF6311)
MIIIYMDFFWYILKKYSQFLIPIFLGIAAFILVTGGKILWPSNINWLKEDAIEALCAWEFFRYTPVFQNPLGANYPYGMGIGGSIIYQDPLFILTFPFKLFSSLLPTPFQYLGIWTFLCFILQALFSWKLLEKITDNQWVKFLGSIFFVLSPAFLSRYISGTFFLGQWLILAAIWLYLSLCFRSYAWCILLCISSLVHAYILFMLMGLWAADLLKRIILSELTYQKLIKHIFLTVLILLIVMWQAGYFMLHSGYVAPGFGLYRMNLLSFIDPFVSEWSRILVAHSHTAGDYEGFSYLGLGIIILGIVGLAGFLNLKKKRQIKIIFFNIKKIAPLFGISFLLMVFALSNNIVLGRYELFQYKLPEIVGIFRASGRMALPLYYLIYLGVFYLIVRCYKKSTSILLIFICLALQITDSFKEFNKIRNLIKTQVYNSPLKASVWPKAAKKYKKIFYTLPALDPDKWDWRALARYAAFNRLSINAGYFARQNVELFNKKKVALINKLIHGELDKDAFYIVKDKNMLRFIVNAKMNLSYKICKADGYFLVLPNWTENLNKTEQYELENYQGYILDTHIFLRKMDENSKNNVMLVKGWSAPEENGTWTDGDSLMVLQLDKKTDSDLSLTIEGSPYINVEHPTLEVDIVVNHKNIEHVTYNIDDSPSNKQVIIPKSILNDNNVLSIEFKFKNAVSPKQLKLSSDNRKLGLFILSLNLTKKISQ